MKAQLGFIYFLLISQFTRDAGGHRCKCPSCYFQKKARVSELPYFERMHNVCQKSLDHPYSVRNFPPPSFFAAEMTIVRPLLPSYNVESIAKALSYLERHHFSIQCYSYQGTLQFVCSINHRKCSKTFGRYCSSLQLTMIVLFQINKGTYN